MDLVNLIPIDPIIYSGMPQIRIQLASVVRHLKLQIFHITFWLVAYRNAWSIFQGTFF